MPSHIIAPAVHVNQDQVEADFRRVHTHLPPDRDLSEPTSLLAEARAILRDRFLAADVGITGANFLVAETGSSIIVTNEGNGDLTQILPRIHIVIASLEKIVPTLMDASTILRLLARSATGQDMSVYTTVSTGPRRPEDPDGPAEYHVVILDNGRTAMLGTEYQEMLRCIRCGACMNHCPGLSRGRRPRLRRGLSRTDGRRARPGDLWAGEDARASERLDLLRALRERLPDDDPAAEADAALARQGVRARPLAGDAALRHPLLGLLRGAAKALPACHPHRHARARQSRAQPRPLRQPAARRRLDQAPRHAGAGRPHLHGSLQGREGTSVSGREAVLGKVRRALGVSGEEAARRSAVAARLGDARPNLIPARGQRDKEGRIALFRAMAEKVSATVERLASPADVPTAIAAHLRKHNLPMSIRTGVDPAIESLAVGARAASGTPHRCLRRPRRRLLQPCLRRRGGVRHADAPLRPGQSDDAEFPSRHAHRDASAPTTSPATTRRSGAAFARLYGPGKLPRTVNLVTGPSRSADIEQTLILGAHGPRALHILVVG